MADKELSVGVRIAFQNDATAAPGALREIRTEAESAGSALDNLTETTTDAGKGLSDLAGSAGDVGGESGSALPKVAALKGVMEGLRVAANGGADAGFGAAKAIESIGKVAGGSAAQLGLVTAAFWAGWKAGGALYDVISKLWADSVPMMDDLGRSAAETKRSLQGIADAEMEFTGLEEGIKKAEAAYDRLIEKAKQAAQANMSLISATAGRDTAKLNLQEKQELAGASTDEQRAAIRAKYDLLRAEVQMHAEIRKSDEEMALATKQAETLLKKQEQLLQAVNAAIEQRLAAEERRREIEKTIADAGYDVRQLRLNPDQLKQATADASQAVTDIAGSPRGQIPGVLDEAAKLYEALVNLPEAFKVSYEVQQKANEAYRSHLDQLVAVNTELQGMNSQLATLRTQREETQLNQQSKAIELDQSSRQSIDGLEAALRQLYQDLSAARSGLSQAQAGGGTADQTAALGRVQSIEAEIARTRTEIDAARASLTAGIESFGPEISAVTAAVRATAETAKAAVQASGEEGKQALEQSAETVKTSTEKAVTDIDAGTGVVKQAADGAGGRIADSMDRMAGAVEQMGETIATRLSSVESRITNVESTASAAMVAAQVAQAQIRNSR